MWRLVDSRKGYARREFLRAGAASLSGLLLSAGWNPRDVLAANRLTTGKSVVFLFLHGGPSQIETFDPKMGAPAEIRSVTDEVSTTIPGVSFGGTFPQLAQRADRLAIVRSFVPGDSLHNLKPLVGKDSAGANLGSIYASVVGSNRPSTGMPTNAALFPQAVVPLSQPAQTQFGNFASSGALGGAYVPFVPGAGGELQQNMELSIDPGRLADRRSLLTELDRARRRFDAAADDSLSNLREQAFGTILGGAAGAFDLSQEDPRTIARYDTAALISPDRISRQWKNFHYYIDHVQTLGRLMLLARRLCEAGCGFVTVTTNFVWDNHGNKDNTDMHTGMQYCGAPFDHAVAAFLDDVAERGLSDKILLVCCGEMGRTPRVNDRGGRDHWANLGSLLLAGGGLKMGQVIGQSDRNASEPNGEPVRIPNLLATIMHTLFDVNELRVARRVSNDVLRVATGADPIRGL